MAASMQNLPPELRKRLQTMPAHMRAQYLAAYQRKKRQEAKGDNSMAQAAVKEKEAAAKRAKLLKEKKEKKEQLRKERKEKKGQSGSKGGFKFKKKKKRKVPVKDAQLRHILRCAPLLEAFKKYCATQFCEENLDFWLAVEEYHSIFDSSAPDMTIFTDGNNSSSCYTEASELDSSEAGSLIEGEDVDDLHEGDDDKEEITENNNTPREVVTEMPSPRTHAPASDEQIKAANFLLNTYVKINSNKEVNIDYATKMFLQNIIEKENKIFRDTFDMAQREVYKLLEQDVFPRFKEQPAYNPSLLKAT